MATKKPMKKPVVKKEVVTVVTTTTTTETVKKAPVKKSVAKLLPKKIAKKEAPKVEEVKQVTQPEATPEVKAEDVSSTQTIKAVKNVKVDERVSKEETVNSLNEILELTSKGGIGKELNPDVPTIDVQAYTKKFKKFMAAEDVSFKVGHGVIHGFIGPNGSGKTTTIKAMIGAYIPTKGKILINGHKAGSVAANQLIGYIPERASFPSHLNTIQYLVAMGQLSGLKAKDAKEKAIKILETLGLSSHAKRQPTKFSSGMQKKILLAQSLMTNPKILILDEPAANLDPTARKELFDQLIFLRDQGKTILISSHILSELERLIDEVSFLYYGEIIFSGKIDEFNDKASDIYIKTTDNIKLASFLKEKGFKVDGDLKTEVIIHHISRDKANELMAEIVKAKFTIMSFRANDLQSVYDTLIEKAVLDKKGHQSIGGVKAVDTLDAKKQAEKDAAAKAGK